MDNNHPTIDRIDVWLDSQQLIESYFSKIIHSIKYSSLNNIQLPIDNQQCSVEVINKDTIDATLMLKQQRFDPLLLNMANDLHPGGGIDIGCGAQEEDLFRRSNYFLTLTSDFYPLENADVVYSPQVTIFKSNETSGYQLMAQTEDISIIACPAIRHPQISRNVLYFENDSDRDLMKEKIRMIFKTAIRHNHDSLVLSAHGCGAWCCPPLQMAELYKEVIDEFEHCFRTIVFAILKNPLLQIGTQVNYDIFYRVLKPGH